MWLGFFYLPEKRRDGTYRILRACFIVYGGSSLDTEPVSFPKMALVAAKVGGPDHL